MDDAAEVVEADALEDSESPVVTDSVAVAEEVAEEAAVVAATRTPAEVVNFTPQTASESNVNAMFLASQSRFWRVTESIFKHEFPLSDRLKKRL